MNKDIASLADLVVFLFLQFKFGMAILYFADVDYSVGSLNDDVYLCSGFSNFTTPRIA